VTITQSVTVSGKIILRWCVVQGGVNTVVDGDLYGNLTYAFIDACDLSAPGGDALNIDDINVGTHGSIGVTVQNSYLHGSAAGIYTLGETFGSLTFVHDTIQGNTTGFYGAIPPSPNLSVVFANNLITGSTTGISLGGPVGNFHHNALFGNTTNYDSGTPPGMGDVTADPMLTGTTPPGLAAGSPLIGAGDPTLVTMYDFFGKPRNGRADIGAVEGP
jgi:hypothetical protein